MAVLDVTEAPPASAAGVALLGGAAEAVAAHVSQSVVEVRTRGGGAGAGTIWHRDGVIVTNHHVVPRDRAEIVLADGTRLQGAVRARDPHNDLALIEVDAHDLPAATIGDARRLRPGEVVLAIGHPFGVTGALTIGVVHKALPPRWHPFGDRGRRELVEADVLLGPGNSGGPLADAAGRVVGINAMVYGRLALAVPSHLATQLVAHPEGPPVIGVSVQEARLAPAQVVAAHTAGHDVEAGVLVLVVEDDGAAAAAGIMPGDVLLSLAGQRLDSISVLPETLALATGTPLAITVLRGTHPLPLSVTPRRRK